MSQMTTSGRGLVTRRRQIQVTRSPPVPRFRRNIARGASDLAMVVQFLASGAGALRGGAGAASIIRSASRSSAWRHPLEFLVADQLAVAVRVGRDDDAVESACRRLTRRPASVRAGSGAAARRVGAGLHSASASDGGSCSGVAGVSCVSSLIASALTSGPPELLEDAVVDLEIVVAPDEDGRSRRPSPRPGRRCGRASGIARSRWRRRDRWAGPPRRSARPNSTDVASSLRPSTSSSVRRRCAGRRPGGPLRPRAIARATAAGRRPPAAPPWTVGPVMWCALSAAPRSAACRRANLREVGAGSCAADGRTSSSYFRTTPRLSSIELRATAPAPRARSARPPSPGSRRCPAPSSGRPRGGGGRSRPPRGRAVRAHRGTRVRDDLVFLLERRIVDPVVQAAALERVVDLAGPVRGQDDARRPLGPDRAELRDRDLEVRQDLEQVRLELLVGPVDLVDQQDRRNAVRRLERLEQRALDQELGAEDVVAWSPGRPRRAPRGAGSRASGAGSSTRRPRC